MLCHLRNVLRLIATVCLIGLIPASNALAQGSPVELQIETDRVFLSDGDDFGQGLGVNVSYRLRHPIVLTARAGMWSAMQTRFSPENWYRTRRFAISEAGAAVQIWRYETPEVSQEVRFGAGLSLRSRIEERQTELLLPSALEVEGHYGSFEELADITRSEEVQVFQYEGAEYGAIIQHARSFDFGAVMTITYVIGVGRFAFQTHVSQRSYESGTPMLSYGLGLGFRP